MKAIEKVILGSVQFGLNYGINNQTGNMVAQFEVDSIIDNAYKYGIKMIDTSHAYGVSETIIGNALNNLSEIDTRIVSKYPRSQCSVNELFEDSLNRLGVKKLYGYLVHHFDFYIENPNIWNDIRELKNNGRVEKIGFSLYTPDQLEYLLDNNVDVDIIQIPYNIFDRSFEQYFKKIKEHNIEIHVRSVFLQGLFFKDTKTLPEKLLELKPQLDMLHQYCDKQNIGIEQVALNYVIYNKYVDYVLIGLDTSKQLIQNINVINIGINKCDTEFINSLEFKNKKILSPINW